LPSSTPGNTRFPFLTQRPRDDGCGAFVLQMLTGRSYEQIAMMIGWQDGELHRSTWQNLGDVLSMIGWTFEAPRQVQTWDEIEGIAIVHVRQDHFLLYDAENQLIYDPAEREGPSITSNRIPMSSMAVSVPLRLHQDSKKPSTRRE